MTIKPESTLKFVRDLLQGLKEEVIDKNDCLFNVSLHTDPLTDTRHVTVEIDIPLDVEEDPELSVVLFKSIYDKIYQVSENNGGPGITESEIVNINDKFYYRFYPTIEIDEKEYMTLINDENTTTAVMDMVEDTDDRPVTLKSTFAEIKKKTRLKAVSETASRTEDVRKILQSAWQLQPLV